MIRFAILIAAAASAATGTTCDTSGVDIVWLLDESGSVGRSNYNKLKDFVVLTSETFSDGTCFGAVEFSGDNNNRPRSGGNVALPVTCDSESFVEDVNRLVFNRNGWTYTKSAMDFLATSYFPNNQKDEDRFRVLIVATDGYPRGRGDPKFGPSDQKGQPLIESTLTAVGAGDVDRVVYLAIGNDLDLSMFDALPGFNKNRDLYAADNFDGLSSLLLNITNGICGDTETNAPTTSPNTTPTIKPTASPVPRVVTSCANKEVLYINDHSHSITDSMGVAQRAVLDGFFNTLHVGENAYAAGVALGNFAGDFKLVMPITYDAHIANATAQKYLDTWKNGRRKYTQFSRMINLFVDKWTKESTDIGKYVVITSDGKPFLRRKNLKGSRQAVRRECNTFKEYKEQTNPATFLCVQVGGRPTPTSFFECACDHVFVLSQQNVSTYMLGEQLANQVCS